ncbi:hypothetical protein [Telluribacter sp. SYSU D00476]|uniref:hypothetical protein n=1 Tax=Telluribacter sp. SYSU D00476 TaxID=2811430 RepID=UPI001FF1F972|nr:hypothetical protein [Telluribacter sp. SYSU D00476]
MKFLTATGKVIEGDSPVEVFENLKNDSSYDSKLTLWEFLEVLALRIQVYYGKRVSIRGMGHLLTQLEEIGYLIRLE